MSQQLVTNWARRLDLTIPLSSPTHAVEVYSLAPHGGGYRVSDLAYLQYVRSGILKTLARAQGCEPEQHDIAIRYHTQEARFAEMLADSVATYSNGAVPDAVLEVPSSRPFNAPYSRVFRARFPDALDLTKYVQRGQIKSGEKGVAAEDVYADTRIPDLPDVGAVQTLILIDDVLGSGKTIAAVLRRLEERGLSPTVRKIVAAPLFVGS